MRIEFDAGEHAYWIDGKRVPSVTQVLGPLSDFSGIDAGTLEHARVRGQLVHDAMALLVRDALDWSSLDPSILPYIEGGRRFLEESGITVVASELRVASARLRVAGTLDLLAVWRGFDSIIEYKATAAFPPVAGPQTAAYEQLHSEMFGKRARKRFCVLLQPGDYRIFPLVDKGDSHVFVSALNCHHWRQRHAA